MEMVISMYSLGPGWVATSAMTLDVTLTTAHQWFGALLLALAVTTMCWNFKLLAHPEAQTGEGRSAVPAPESIPGPDSGPEVAGVRPR